MTSVVETAIRSVVNKGVMALATFNRGRMRAPDGPGAVASVAELMRRRAQQWLAQRHFPVCPDFSQTRATHA